VRLNWRITTLRQKGLYIALGWGVLALSLFALRTWILDPRSWTYAVISSLRRWRTPSLESGRFAGILNGPHRLVIGGDGADARKQAFGWEPSMQSRRSRGFKISGRVTELPLTTRWQS
jgi:hypothetical protein